MVEACRSQPRGEGWGERCSGSELVAGRGRVLGSGERGARPQPATWGTRGESYFFRGLGGKDGLFAALQSHCRATAEPGTA